MSQSQSEFILYPKRFVVTGLFALSLLMTSVLLNTLNPIAAYLSEIYHEDPVVVNLGGLLFVLMHPIFTFPAAFITDTYGTRFGIAVGCMLGIIGVSMRMLINYGFYWVILGQVVAGIGRPFIMNCQAKISANWFSAQTRGGITQLLTLVLNVSLIIGVLIPGFFFKGYEPNPSNLDQGKDLTFNLMLFQTIMALICFIPNILFQQSKPPTPPSESGSIEREPFKTAIKKILKNKNYILLLIGFGCYFGIFNGMSIVLSFLIQPWFTNNLPLAVAAVGGSPVLSGILGVMILGPIQRKSGQFKKWILICMTGSLLAIFLFYPLLETNSLLLASFISAFNSFFLIPLVPIMLQLGCELVFPVGEGVAVGLLFAMGNFSGFLLGLFMSMIVKGESKEQTLGGLIFSAGMFIFGMILVFMMKQVKNREKAELQISEQRKSLRSSSVSQNMDRSTRSQVEQLKGTGAVRQNLLNKNQVKNNRLSVEMDTDVKNMKNYDYEPLS